MAGQENNFSVKLFSELVGKKENVVISPFSIFSVLGALAAGADGTVIIIL